ncbi:MAG: hypothetical protein KAR06_01740, partial [Deltaproteobacteria bacterium]|nr:hypothetical protein [Deltaproteobacteria bacterium]
SGLVTLRRSQTVTIEAPAPASITLGINPAEITIRGTATITATVKDAGGFPVIDGTPVTFVVLNTSIGDLSTTYATTANGNGTATTTFTAGIASGTTSIQASAGGVSISRPITVIPADTASIQFVSADPQIINLAQTGLNNTSLVIFTVSDITGWPVVDGTPVEFTLIGPNGGEYLGVNDETPTQHLASTTGGNVSVQLFSGGVSGPVTVKATTYKSSGAESTLSADLSADDTTITLVDASGFPATGRIRIDDEIISYTNNDGTNLTGVIRGDLGTLNVTHDGTTVPAIVYGQSTISTTAPEISIGGGSVSSTHFMSQVVYTDATRMPGKLWIDEYLGTDLYGYGGDPQEFETFFADRFGNYNVIEGTSAAYSMEASGIYSGGSSNPDGGHVTGVLITPSSSPKDVTPNSEELAWIHWVNTTFSDTGAEGILMNSIAAVTTVPETIYLNVSNSDHVVDFIDGSGLHQLRMGSEMMDYTFITGGSSSTFLSADIDLSDTAAFVYDNSSFPSSGTFAVDTNFYTYTSKTISVNAKLSALVLDIVDTTIPYSSPDGTFVVPGIFMIGSEVIECTGDTGTALTGCTRGIDGTNAAFHVSGDNITLAPSFILTAAATTTDLRNSLVAVPVELRIDKRGAPPGTTATATPVASHSALSVVRLFNSINIDVYEYAFREGSHHPRDGWVTIVTRVQGEETFIDENANGVFNRSYNTSSCPLTYSCECDGGVTDAHSSVIGPNDGVRVCAYLRSEAFKDLGEPFIDANEDGFRNDGTVAGSPVESYFDDLTLDNDGDGVTDTKDNQYTGPNGAWDGLDCKGFPCMNSKAVWTKSLVAFVGKPEYCLVTPPTFNISDGRSQEFIFYFADFNNNQLTADTEITFLTPFGVLSALPLYVTDDGVEIGGTVITATLGDPQPGDTNPRVSTSISFVATDSKTTKCYGSTEGFVD